MPLDPETLDLLTKFAESGLPAVQDGTPLQARAQAPMLAELYGAGPTVGDVAESTLDSDGFPLRVRIYRTASASRGVILYLHGGGWVLGSLAEYDALCRYLCRDTGCLVILPEYRLAPEHPFPAAVRDAHIAVKFASEVAADQVSARLPLIVMGDSAGGNLAAVLAQESGRNGPKIDAQILVYPVLGCDLEAGSYLAPENQLLLSTDLMRWFWHHYVPDPSQRRLPQASPGGAPVDCDWPPTVILTAEFDVLKDEGMAYAQKLLAAGARVAYHECAGQTHGFLPMINLLRGAADALAWITHELEAFL